MMDLVMKVLREDVVREDLMSVMNAIMHLSPWEKKNKQARYIIAFGDAVCLALHEMLLDIVVGFA
jgi:hypothetical protein